MPVAGGLAKFSGLERVRNKISIKGYENHWGKAIAALEAVAGLGARLGNLEIVLYSCNAPVLRAAKKLSKSTGMKITTYKKGALSHNQVMELFQSSLIYVGHSLSDGISTSMVEAMAMGAIPVQTSTSCCDEWFQDSGVSVSEITESAVADAILQGLTLAATQANSDKNREIIRQRANAQDVFVKAKTFYQLD